MGIRAHAAIAFRRQLGKLGYEFSVLVEQLFRTITPHPIFEDFQVFGVLLQIGNRNLMRAPRPFHRLSIDGFWASPALRRSHYDHRPFRQAGFVALAGIVLGAVNLLNDVIEGGSHELMHLVWLVSFEE